MAKRRDEPRDIIARFLEARRRREQPASSAGKHVREDGDARRFSKHTLHFASAGTSAPSGEWEELCRLTRGVSARGLAAWALMLGTTGETTVHKAVPRAFETFAELYAHVAEEGREVCDDDLRVEEETVAARPTTAQVARAMGATVDEVKRLQADALDVVSRNMAS